MAVYPRSTRPRFTLLLLVLTSITLLTLDYRGSAGGLIDGVKDGARDAFAPVQDASDRVFSPIGDFLGGIFHYGDLRSENARLRRENEELKGDLLRSADAERERRVLLDQFDLEALDDIPRVEARVVTASPSNFALTVEIDRGTDDGVAKNMPVVTGSGLVGRITDVSRRRSTVMLITEKVSSVGVRLAVAGDLGVATGQGYREPLSVDLIDPATRVEPGEVVVTSGLQQSAFPPGIPVGKVRKAEARPGDLQQTVVVDPVVELRRLSFVTVLQWSPR